VANRSLRRATKPADNGAAIPVIRDGKPESGDVGLSEPIEAAIGDTGANDSVIESESDRVDFGGAVEIDPAKLDEYIRADTRTGTGDSDGGPTRRTRHTRSDAGRPRKQRGRKETAQDIGPLLTMAHTWASVLLKTPELALDGSEVEQLSKAYGVFCEYHEVPVLTPKRASEINMIAAVCVVYGTRLFAIKNRKKAEAEERKRAANIRPFPNGGSQL
jgi:hypothetical protein